MLTSTKIGRARSSGGGYEDLRSRACANWLGGSEAQNEAVRQWLHHCKLTAVYRNSFGEERVDPRLTWICDLALKRKFPKAYVGF